MISYHLPVVEGDLRKSGKALMSSRPLVKQTPVSLGGMLSEPNILAEDIERAEDIAETGDA